jgi:hypothetical protein
LARAVAVTIDARFSTQSFISIFAEAGGPLHGSSSFFIRLGDHRSQSPELRRRPTRLPRLFLLNGDLPHFVSSLASCTLVSLLHKTLQCGNRHRVSHVIFCMSCPEHVPNLLQIASTVESSSGKSPASQFRRTCAHSSGFSSKPCRSTQQPEFGGHVNDPAGNVCRIGHTLSDAFTC